MRIYITILVSILMLTSQSYAKSTLPFEKIKPKALNSLKTFSQLVVKKKNFREMGFESSAQVEKASLGEPVQEYMVRLDKLKEYRDGVNPKALLVALDSAIYPVVVNGKVRSSITMASKKNEWRAASYGSPKLINKITSARATQVRAAGLSKASFFYVKIPALRLYFVGHEKDGKLFLTPILEDKAYGFRAGTSKPAGEVFKLISAAAKKHDGLPR